MPEVKYDLFIQENIFFIMKNNAILSGVLMWNFDLPTFTRALF